MPSKTQRILGTNWKQILTSSIVRFPKLLSPYELTKSSWAAQIVSYDDLPDIYKSFFKPLLTSRNTFPYTILTPNYENFIHKTTEKLISDFGHAIYVLERKGDAFESQCYRVGDVTYIEVRTALLASSFKICGMTNEGEYASSTLKFNSITYYLFTPILKRVRNASIGSKYIAQNKEKEKFNCLAGVNFKFMNFAKHSLMEDEKVIQFILQPDIQENLLTFLRKTYCRTISPTHMSILTDRELIVIREDATRRKEDRYGAIWNYIPLNKIKSLSKGGKFDDLVGLTVQLPGDSSLELIFQTSAEEELNLLSDRFKELIEK